jgi:hypothetical protein
LDNAISNKLKKNVLITDGAGFIKTFLPRKTGGYKSSLLMKLMKRMKHQLLLAVMGLDFHMYVLICLILFALSKQFKILGWSFTWLRIPLLPWERLIQD